MSMPMASMGLEALLDYDDLISAVSLDVRPQLTLRIRHRPSAQSPRGKHTVHAGRWS